MYAIHDKEMKLSFIYIFSLKKNNKIIILSKTDYICIYIDI